MADRPIRDSIEEIDEDSWLIGDRLLLSRSSISDCTWRDGSDRGYKITEATLPLPDTRPLSDGSEIKLVHEAGGVSAVFKIGDAFCKVRAHDIPNVTREHVTLAWLHDHEQNWSFAIPNVLHHAEFDGRDYLILSRVPGETIDSIWPILDESTKQWCVASIVDICIELERSCSRSNIGGVDGAGLPERYLCGRELDCSPANLHQSCLDLGMDCSTFVFCHCDLGPSNILLDLANKSFGIIDWEIAGFVPKEWIKTKFRLSRGMNLSSYDNELDWRLRIKCHMEQLGFADVVERFTAWSKRDTSREGQ